VKVVLFCGGQGIRLREHSEAIPKPMVRIGYRPILWHVMRYYAHFGHRDFILCLGYRGDAIKDYFLTYQEELSNDFVLSDGGRTVSLLGSDIQDWRITFADTGLHSTIGERLLAVRRHLMDEDVFLANYGDTLTDAPLDRILEETIAADDIATFLSVRPPYSFHVVRQDPDGAVTSIEDAAAAGVRINGGLFIFRREIFDYLAPRQDIVEEPFDLLARENRLHAVPWNGFWLSLDTLKELGLLLQHEASGSPPWAVWQPGRDDGGTGEGEPVDVSLGQPPLGAVMR